MKRKVLVAFISLLLVSGLTLSACAQPAPAPVPAPAPAPKPAPAPEVQEITIEFGAGEVTGDFGAILGDAFKEMIGEASEGKITVKIHPYGTIGNAADLLGLIQSGVIHITNGGASYMSGFVPEINAFSIDYVLPPSNEALLWVLDNGEIAKVMEDLFRDEGFHYIGGSSIGWIWRSSNKPLYTLDDFKDFKMRVIPSAILVEDYKVLGANPTPLSWGEVYGGLQMGLIDGQENPLRSIVAGGFHEVQSYVTNPFTRSFLHTHVANPKWWDSLNEETKRVINLTYHAATKHAMGYYERENEALRDGGLQQLQPDIVIHEMTQEEIAPFKEVAKKVWDVYLQPDIGGPNAKEFLDVLQRDMKAAEAKFGK